MSSLLVPPGWRVEFVEEFLVEGAHRLKVLVGTGEGIAESVESIGTTGRTRDSTVPPRPWGVVMSIAWVALAFEFFLDRACDYVFALPAVIQHVLLHTRIEFPTAGKMPNFVMDPPSSLIHPFANLLRNYRFPHSCRLFSAPTFQMR